MSLPFVDANLDDFQKRIRAAWHGLVSKREILINFQTTTVLLAIACPVVPTADAGAESVHYGLFETNQVRKIEIAIQRMLLASPVASVMIGTDGAHANERMFGYLERKAKTPTGLELCLNHGNHKVEETTSSCTRALAGRDIISGLTTLAACVRSGSFYLRTVCALSPYLDQRVLLEVGIQHPADAAINAEFMSYALRWFQRFQRVYRVGEETAEQKRRREKSWYAFKMSWELFVKVWTGPLGETTDGKIKVMVPFGAF